MPSNRVPASDEYANLLGFGSSDVAYPKATPAPKYAVYDCKDNSGAYAVGMRTPGGVETVASFPITLHGDYNAAYVAAWRSADSLADQLNMQAPYLKPITQPTTEPTT